MNHYLYIVDDDYEYSTKLATYLNSRDGFPFIIKCVNKETLYLDNAEKADLIIMDESNYKSIKNKYIKDKTIVLTESSTQEIGGIRYLSKYKSCESISKDILNYSADIDALGSFVNRKSTLKIYGFYSPVKRCGQSTLCRELGRELSKRSSTLYLSLESFSGLETTQGKKYEKNIGDLIYSYESGRSNMGAVIGSLVENIDGVDTIPPMKGHDELAGINIWTSIISMIETYTDYEYLIIDISDAVSDIGELLNLSNRVITIEEEDIVSKGKVNEYEEILLRRGYDEVINKTVKWQVSKNKSNARLLMSNLLTGDYV